MIPARLPRSVLAFLSRYRTTLAIAMVAVLASSATAVAVSYLVLGSVNTSATTTTLKSAVNGAVLQLTDTNTSGGTNARGLGIRVPAGRAPISVNASAGKATNLNSDKLDGLNSTQFARGTNVTTVANRVVLAAGEYNKVVLTVPGLGRLFGWCTDFDAGQHVEMYWRNTSSASIDMWSNTNPDARLRPTIVAAGPGPYRVAALVTSDGIQNGDTLLLGQGNSPGPRKTATVDLAVYRSGAGAPCALQATATVWSTP